LIQTLFWLLHLCFPFIEGSSTHVIKKTRLKISASNKKKLLQAWATLCLWNITVMVWGKVGAEVETRHKGINGSWNQYYLSTVAFTGSYIKCYSHLWTPNFIISIRYFLLWHLPHTFLPEAWFSTSLLYRYGIITAPVHLVERGHPEKCSPMPDQLFLRMQFIFARSYYEDVSANLALKIGRVVELKNETFQFSSSFVAMMIECCALNGFRSFSQSLIDSTQ